jgi:hypothetical protein
MINAIFRPVAKWPGTPTNPSDRRVSPFSATYTDTMIMLERELQRLGASNIVIECQVDRSQIRNDGWMKGNRGVVFGPAVILSFKDSENGQFRYPCDTFTHWKANLRAIALSLEALRKIDRYGVTRRGEQYQGFKQLPAANAAEQMSPEEAARWMMEHSPGTDMQLLLTDRAYFDAMLKLASKRLHPDTGGNHENFIKLQEVGGIIDKILAAKAAGG